MASASSETDFLGRILIGDVRERGRAAERQHRRVVQSAVLRSRLWVDNWGSKPTCGLGQNLVDVCDERQVLKPAVPPANVADSYSNHHSQGAAREHCSDRSDSP
jgi:hypothetical protein